jgi:hypothetical protein
VLHGPASVQPQGRAPRIDGLAGLKVRMGEGPATVSHTILNGALAIGPVQRSAAMMADIVALAECPLAVLTKARASGRKHLAKKAEREPPML